MAAQPFSSLAALRLRTGSHDDLDEVMRIMAAAFRPCFGEGWTRSQCAGILPLSGVTLTLAESEGTIFGFSLMRTVAEEAELLLIAVDPARQGEGIGSRLLTHFIQTNRTAGTEKLHLEVRDGNPAVNLYRTAGFTLVGRRRAYYRGTTGEQFDALTLVLD